MGVLRGRNWPCNLVLRFWDGILEIFGTGFGQSWTVWGLVVIPGLRSPGFVVCFDDLESNEKKKRFIFLKGPRGALFFIRFRYLGHFMCYYWKNK